MLFFIAVIRTFLGCVRITRPGRPVSAFRSPLVWSLAVLSGLAGMGSLSANFFVPSAAQALFHLDQVGASYLISTGFTLAIFVNLLFGFLMDRFNRWKVMAALAGLGALGGIAMTSHDLTVFRIGTALVLALGHAGIQQSYTLAADVLRGRETGNVMGVVSMVAGVFSYLGPQMLGLLRDWSGGFESGWYFIIGAAAATLVLVLALWNYSSSRARVARVGVLLTLLMLMLTPPASPQSVPPSGQYKYPFQNPDIDREARITNILSLMTLEEKIQALGTTTAVPRLGVPDAGGSEGLHGLVQRPLGGLGSQKPVPTTQFAQVVGMAQTWDADLIHKAGEVQAVEARWLYNHQDKYQRRPLIVWGPNTDLARDPRWGRIDESYGEDAFFTGTMAAAFAKGMQGDDPKYWRVASLLKHLLANSNENGRYGSSSDFDERLLREYYSLSFRMAFTDGGASSYMASYNAWNGVPMTVNPILKSIVAGEWGVNGIVSTDAGAVHNMVTKHRYFPRHPAGCGGVREDRCQPVPGRLSGWIARGAGIESNHGARYRCRAAREVPGGSPPGFVGPAGTGAVYQDRFREEPWSDGCSQSRGAASGAREHRPVEERRRPTARWTAATSNPSPFTVHARTGCCWAYIAANRPIPSRLSTAFARS